MRTNVDSDMLRSMVSGGITEFVNQEMSFTAYDVTTLLRSQFPNVNIMHYEARDLVHDVMLSVTEYSSRYATITLKGTGATVQAIEYYPAVNDETDEPDWGVSADDIDDVDDTGLPNWGVSDDDGGAVNKTADKYHRLCVPKAFVGDIEKFWVIAEYNRLVIKSDESLTPEEADRINNKEVPAVCYKTDCYGNFKISLNRFSDAKNFNHFTFKPMKDNEFVVEFNS